MPHHQTSGAADSGVGVCGPGVCLKMRYIISCDAARTGNVSAVLRHAVFLAGQASYPKTPSHPRLVSHIFSSCFHVLPLKDSHKLGSPI